MADEEDDSEDQPGEIEAEILADEEEETRPRIDEVLKSLPLIEHDLYLGMQAMNLTIVQLRRSAWR